MKLYQIGDFSKITKLTVKALRLYHEKAILEPSHIDDQTGYRYYGENQLERAYTIRALKQLDFSLKEIGNIMRNFNEDAEMVSFLKNKTHELETKMEHYRTIKNQLDVLVSIQEKESMKNYSEQIEVRQLPAIEIAGIRYKGKYEDVGHYFKRLFKFVGFQMSGKPGCLYYDREYRENDADIEAFVPVKKPFSKAELSSRCLKGGKAHCLIHIGPYTALTRSYKRILDYLVENNIQVEGPSREIYIKGPGLIFKGNPEKYVTELQFFEY